MATQSNSTAPYVSPALAAAKKVKCAFNIAGPFPACKKPLADRPGLYLRISPNTGAACWAYWNGKAWGLWSDSKAGAMRRRDKISKKPARWFGFAGR